MRKLHLAFTGLSVTIILLSINRLTDFTLSYLQPYDFLRWLDFNAMLPIPILSIIFYYLIKKDVEAAGKQSSSQWLLPLNLLFMVGIYLYGTSSGTHEVTNYLSTRFCARGTIESELCNIVAYNDDTFSHMIYFIGLIVLNISLIFIENIMPRRELITQKDLTFITTNALFIALGIFANLAFEPTTIDIVSFGSVMLLTLYLLFFSKNKYNKMPVTYYFGVAYTIGIFATVIYKLVVS